MAQQDDCSTYCTAEPARLVNCDKTPRLYAVETSPPPNDGKNMCRYVARLQCEREPGGRCAEAGADGYHFV